jgi:hypothetical protein
LWTKTEAAAGSIVSLNPVTSTGTVLGYPTWHNTPDWSRSVVVFDSMENSTVEIQMTVQPTPTAKIWIDDLTIEDVGLLNVTKRDDCPILIKGDDGTIFNELVDVDEIKDPFVPAGAAGPVPDELHDTPQPALSGNSRLHENQTVLMDYYAAALVENKPTLCINEGPAKAMLKAEIKRVMTLTHPRYVFINVDHVKALGWDPACEANGGSAGAMLANFIREEAAAVTAVDPTAQVATYSSMFDPDADAKETYFMARGGTAGSFRGLPKNTILLNDNFVSGAQSLKFFSHLGCPQILLGYFDNAAGVPPIDQWQKASNGIPGVKGFCYVTRVSDYSHLTDFIHSATGASH